MTAGARRAPLPRLARHAAIATIAALAWLAGASEAAAQRPDRAPVVEAEASALIDARSGTVIVEEEADERRPIASATKLMTALLTLERARPADVLAAADYDPAPIESQIGLGDGERMAVRDLLAALLLESANDAAVTLAVGLEGSTDAFVADMNRRAEALGLDDTRFANPIGFDDPENYSTASDLALLARHLMRKHRFRDIVEEPRLELGSGDVPRVVDNRNDLVGEVPSVDGVKTGQTDGAGHVLVGSAEEDGNRVISVVLGAPSEQARDEGSLELLGFGLDQFRERRVVRAGQPVDEVPAAHADGASVELAAAEGVSVTVLRGEAVETRVEAPPELEGPVAAGEEVGSLAVVHRDREVARVPLLTAAPVAAPGLLTRIVSTLEDHLAAAVAVVLSCVMLIVALHVRRTRTRPGSHSVT